MERIEIIGPFTTTEQRISNALTVASQFMQTEKPNWNLYQNTFIAIDVFAEEGLKSHDQTLFSLSAENLVNFVSEAPEKYEAFFNSKPHSENAPIHACHAVEKQIDVLGEYIKNGKKDINSIQRRQFSIRLLNESIKHGHNILRKKSLEMLVETWPLIINYMVFGSYGFDETAALILNEKPSLFNPILAETKNTIFRIKSSDFRPRISSLLTHGNTDIRIKAKKIAENLLARFGFNTLQISEYTEGIELSARSKLRKNPTWLTDKAQDIDTIFAIENQMPGITNWLRENRGVKYVGRYPEKLLLDQYLHRNDTTSPWGIIIYPYDDHNGAFYQQPAELTKFQTQLTEVNSKLGTTYRLRLIEGGNLFSLSKKLLTLNKKYGPATFALIGAHGSPASIQFGDVDELNTGLSKKNIETGKGIQRLVKRLFIPDAQVVLSSCSTGRRDGIAQSLSKLDMIVTAPKRDGWTENINVTAKQNKIFVEATYNKKNVKNRFKKGVLLQK